MTMPGTTAKSNAAHSVYMTLLDAQDYIHNNHECDAAPDKPCAGCVLLIYIEMSIAEYRDANR